MCQSADLTGINADHCVAGYNDGNNGITPSKNEEQTKSITIDSGTYYTSSCLTIRKK
jgi:hypothetical protein